MNPTSYFVEYVVRWIEDEPPETNIENVESLAAARRVYDAHLLDLPQIFERRNIRDATPAGDPRGLIWDFDEQLIVDCPEDEEVAP